MRTDKAYLQDISNAINSIESFLEGKDREEFFKSDLLQSAVMRKLEIIGEATKNLNKELKSKYKNVPWKSAAGMRNFLIHRYFGVNVERVWETVKKSLPQFKQQVSGILNEMEQDNAGE